MVKERGRVRGVYTVEAAFILPIVIFTMAVGICAGVDLYQETAAVADDHREVDELEELETVHRLRSLSNLWEAIGRDAD